jgi:hypothetical protein
MNARAKSLVLSNMLSQPYNPVVVQAATTPEQLGSQARPDERDYDEMRQVYLDLGRVSQVRLKRSI